MKGTIMDHMVPIPICCLAIICDYFRGSGEQIEDLVTESIGTLDSRAMGLPSIRPPPSIVKEVAQNMYVIKVCSCPTCTRRSYVFNLIRERMEELSTNANPLEGAYYVHQITNEGLRAYFQRVLPKKLILLTLSPADLLELKIFRAYLEKKYFNGETAISPDCTFVAHPDGIIERKCKLRDEQCAICIDKMGDADHNILLPCGHFFHYECCQPWLLDREATCPLCKKLVIIG